MQVQAQDLLKDVGLPNSYTLTKHMAEGLVADMHAAGALPVAIVRPSIIGCIAHKPVPGYFGNSAGLTSAILAFASGEFMDFHPKREICCTAHMPSLSKQLGTAWPLPAVQMQPSITHTCPRLLLQV